MLTSGLWWFVSDAQQMDQHNFFFSVAKAKTLEAQDGISFKNAAKPVKLCVLRLRFCLVVSIMFIRVEQTETCRRTTQSLDPAPPFFASHQPVCIFFSGKPSFFFNQHGSAGHF